MYLLPTARYNVIDTYPNLHKDIVSVPVCVCVLNYYELQYVSV
jgi:hypothetical protein